MADFIGTDRRFARKSLARLAGVALAAFTSCRQCQLPPN
jgi:hypothetical protein